MLDDAFLADWCQRQLGAPPAQVLFRTGHLSEVAGAELADGRRVVIKCRPADPRITGCTAVQERLARGGFPCPMPLIAPVLVGGFTVTAETMLSGGTQLLAADGVAAFAALLAWLVRAAPSPAEVPELALSPPWTGWDHPGQRLWPDLDDRGRDLNLTPGPGWIDDAARRVRERLGAVAAPVRIGHGDWESQNIRWTGSEPLAVHDWDSVIAQPEPAIVGLASAVWPAAGAPDDAATVAQSAAFIAAYQQAADRSWAEPEVQEAWAAGLWVRLFNAKKEASDGGGPQLDRLAGELGDRLAQAGLS